MRQKKILLVLCTVFVFLVGLCSVSAKVVCEYEISNTDMVIKIIADSGAYGGELNAYIGFVNDDNIQDNGDFVTLGFKFQDQCPSTICFDTSQGYMAIYDSSHCDANEAISLSHSESTKVYCGSGEGMITGIPKKIPELTSLAIVIIQVAIPVILVIMGSIDLFKGITAGKEDEIKKGQQMFIKRLVVAVVIFLIVIVVKFFVSVIADTNQMNIIDCIDCFVSNDCNVDVNSNILWLERRS